MSNKIGCQQCQKVKSINFYVALMPSTISSAQGVGFFNIRSSRVLEKILDRSVLGQVGVLNYSVTYWALTISNEEAGWSKVYKVYTRKIKTSLYTSNVESVYLEIGPGQILNLEERLSQNIAPR